MLRFEWFRRWLGGRWYLCEFPGYDCGGIYEPDRFGRIGAVAQVSEHFLRGRR